MTRTIPHKWAGIVVMAILLAAGVTAARADATADVKAVLDAQVVAWNAGDIKAFMAGYDNSPETTFVGSKVAHGWQEVFDNYEKNYGSKDKMGTLSFNELQVRVLDEHVAVVTGRYHLVRTAAGGGDATGIYSLVFHKTAAGWKIVLDHTNPGCEAAKG
jgi:uncharacterized protein (TIGR02246 family)